MPQLSPINWLFLFMMFWMVITLATCLLWWMVVVKFYFMVSGTSKTGKSVKSEAWMFCDGDSGLMLSKAGKVISKSSKNS